MKNHDDVMNLGQGNQVAYLLRRLARERPDLLNAFERGEFKSARAVDIAAGIVKPPTALDILRRTWAKASPDECAWARCGADAHGFALEQRS